MIIAFRSKSSEVLERFLKNFVEPSKVWQSFVHAWIFTSKDVIRRGDVVIIRSESFVDVIARQVLVGMIIMFFIGYVLNYAFLMSFGALSIILCMFLVSKSVRGLLFVWELKRGGHNEKISFLSNAEVIDVLLVGECIVSD